MRGGNLLWAALEAARRRNLADAGEAPPLPGSPGIARRALLQSLAGAGLAASLSRPAAAAPPGTRIAIVGGGIAGLSALHYLREAGVDARVYEARNRLGGRMHTLKSKDGMFEMGGQLVNSDHADIHALARAFDIPLVDRKTGPHYSVILANGKVVPQSELVELLRPIAAQISADSDRLDRDFDKVAPALDRISVAQYLDRHAALMPDPRIRRLLEASIRTEYGAEPEEASALQLIFNLPTVHGERIEVLAGSDERYAIAGGSGALPEAIAARHADRIETGRRLLSIDRHGAGVRLRFVDGTTADADRVIVAVPAPILRQIDFRLPLPALWRAFNAEIDLGRCEKLQAATTGHPWQQALGTGGELWDVDAGYALGWDGTVRPHRGDGEVWCWYLGGNQVDAAAATDPVALSRTFTAAAEPAIKGLGAAMTPRVRATRWCQDALTLGAYTNNSPGQLTRFASLFWVESDDPSERRQAVAGRVIFAGEHVSDAWVGFMNGGAQTGRLAAEAIVGRALLKQAA
jgi:monoamine oxidase